MSVGTKFTPYDTKGAPESFPELKQTEVHLVSTYGMLTIPDGRVTKCNYILQRDLVAEVRFETDKYVAVDYQVDEYGIGDSWQEAEQDLLDSLVDYLTSLERRENRLSDRESRYLQALRNIIKK
jgi:hypothetical protein